MGVTYQMKKIVQHVLIFIWLFVEKEIVIRIMVGGGEQRWSWRNTHV